MYADTSASQKGTCMNVVTANTGNVGFSRTSFLVVDSKPMFRELSHGALTYLQARDIKMAQDVNEAVTILKRFGHIGGLICDWDLAPVGGLELLRMIRSRTMTKVS